METLLTLACRWKHSGTEMRNYFCLYVSGRNDVFLYAGPVEVRAGNACFIGPHHELPAHE